MANEKLVTLKNLTTYNDKIQDKITAIDNTIAILDAEGDGNSYLANDGTYKVIESNSVTAPSFNLTLNLTNTSINYTSNTVTSPFMAIVKPVQEFVLSDLTIMMGENDITYDNEVNGIIIIPNVTGDITITATSNINKTSYVGDDNDIILDLPAGEYTLAYEDANNNLIDNFDEITTVTI